MFIEIEELFLETPIKHLDDAKFLVTKNNLSVTQILSEIRRFFAEMPLNKHVN